VVGGQDELARFFWIFEYLNASRFEKRHGFVKDAAFGEGKCEHIFYFHGVSAAGAPQGARGPSMGSEVHEVTSVGAIT
jgi:hypothetical protein